jgi:hypothetical protein
MKHLDGNVLAGHPVGEQYLAVLLKLVLQVPLNQKTYQGYTAE